MERGTERLVSESPTEFFRERLGRAMQHQGVSTSAFTESYLVNLLARAVHADALPAREAGYDETPLALLYARALGASSPERARLLRVTGDMALFVSGFFSDSVGGDPDLGYYRCLGESAYGRLGRLPRPGSFVAELFAELARRFSAYADLLQEISETTRLTSDASVVRLYERWLQTGSRRAAALLEARGISPLPPGEGRLQ